MAIISSGNSNIDSFLLGGSWTGSAGQAATINYTIFADKKVFGNFEYYEVNKSYKNAIEAVLAEYSKVANVNFVYQPPSTTAPSTEFQNLNFDLKALGAGILGQNYVLLSSGAATDGTQIYSISNIELSTNLIDTGDDFFSQGSNGLVPGEQGYSTLIHEVGHALGLAHPDRLTGSGVSFLDAELALSEVHEGASTMLSISGFNGPFMTNDTTSKTLMYYDIPAIQYLYGANMNYNIGNNYYAFNGYSDAQTIWDAGGIDTFDFSAVGVNSTYDIRVGLSNPSQAQETRIWVSQGVDIENLFAGSGSDIVNGNDLANVVKGNSGNDTIYSYLGNDDVNGNRGNDIVYGQGGDDILRGGKDFDTVYGGAGNDWINGNLQNDILYGEAGNDTIRGGKSEDNIYGGAGNDVIYGNKGNDTLTGGGEADIFIFKAGDGVDIITDFNSANDVIHFTSTVFASVADVLNASSISGTSTVIDAGGGNNVTIQGFASLDASDIIII